MSNINKIEDLVNYCAKKKPNLVDSSHFQASSNKASSEIGQFIRDNSLMETLHSAWPSAMTIPGFGVVWSPKFLLAFLDAAITIGKKDKAAQLVNEAIFDISKRLTLLGIAICDLRVQDPIKGIISWADKNVNLELKLGGTTIKLGPEQSLKHGALFRSIEITQDGQAIKCESRDIDNEPFRTECFIDATGLDPQRSQMLTLYSRWVHESRLIEGDRIITQQHGSVYGGGGSGYNTYLLDGDTNPGANNTKLLHASRA